MTKSEGYVLTLLDVYFHFPLFKHSREVKCCFGWVRSDMSIKTVR